ncbi:hypothetical protein D1872_262630 [compost metagenome]
MQQLSVDLLFNIAVNRIVLRPQHIGQQKLVSVPIDIERLVKRHLRPYFAVAAQIHQNFIFDTAGGIRRQFDFLLGIKRVDRLDQSDRTDGNQILDIDARILELSGDINDQSEIPFDQHGPDRGIAGRELLEQIFFFLARQWRRQRFTPADIIDFFAF